jgi:hypothetical protein
MYLDVIVKLDVTLKLDVIFKLDVINCFSLDVTMHHTSWQSDC